MKRVTSEINERKRGVETMTKIVDIQETSSGLPKDLFPKQNQEFITDGDLKCKIGKHGKEKIRRLYLFRGLLVVLRKKGHSKPFKYVTHVELIGATIDGAPTTGIKIALSSNLMVIMFDNDTHRQKWQGFLDYANYSNERKM